MAPARPGRAREAPIGPVLWHNAPPREPPACRAGPL